MEKTEPKEKLLIGITGGIGSGKSSVSAILEAKGYTVIQTDILAKEVIFTNFYVQNKIISSFGPKSFKGNKYNEKYIAEIVFADKNQLTKLNQIVLPAAIEELIDIIDELQDATDVKDDLIFIESAILFELELENGFDYTISVSAPLEMRIERLKLYRNLTDSEIKKSIKSQMTQEEKNKNSDFIIENSSDLLELEKKVDALLPILKIIPHKVVEDEEENTLEVK